MRLHLEGVLRLGVLSTVNKKIINRSVVSENWQKRLILETFHTDTYRRCQND